MHQCPTEHTLAHFLAGTLSQQELDAVDQHMDSCLDCRKAISVLVKATQHSTVNPITDGFEPVPCQLSPGSIVEHFRVIRLLGKGAFGRVYLARDQRLGRKVALKMMSAQSVDSLVLDQFFKEAQITAQLNHPNLIAIHHIGTYQQSPYLVLEYLEGQNLRLRIAQLSQTEALRYAITIAQALQELHRCDVLHGDLKPENIIIPADGRLRIVDFGLAQLIDDTNRTTQIRAGTPAYMAPEQWSCQPCTKATDIWAMGILLHELYYGMRPFSDEAIQRLQHDQQIELLVYRPTIFSPINRLMAQCLQHDPNQRPHTTALVEKLCQLQATGQSQHANPFAGLQPFAQEQAGLFYGREAEVLAFCEQLRVSPTMTVVGPSGAGKSSFIAAGVIPRLREQNQWHIFVMRPGPQPFTRLATALHQVPSALQTSGEAISYLRSVSERDNVHVLLVVDQLEEILTQTADQTQRDLFLDVLRYAGDDAADPLRVVLTLREDYMGKLASYDHMRHLLRSVFALGRPTKEALCDIIVKPLGAVGYRYDDPALVETILTDLQHQSVCLPLFQIAAQLLWAKRNEAEKTVSAQVYRDLGGICGAAGQHAEEVIAQLTSRQLEVAHRIFLRLVSVDGTRRSATRDALLAQLSGDASTVLDHLIQQRLLLVGSAQTPQDADIELVHEQLAQTWPRLTRWLEESREERILRNELEVAAQRWHHRGRQLVDLWQGGPLQEATRVFMQDATAISTTANEFTAAGLSIAKRKQRRRRLLQVAAVTAVVLLFAAGISVHYTTRTKNKQIGLQKAVTLYEGAWSAFRQNQFIEARAKLRSAAEITDSLSGRALWWYLQQTASTHVDLSIKSESDFGLSPHGQRIALIRTPTVVQLLDVATFAQLAEFRHIGSVFTLAYDPKEHYIATGTLDGQLSLWRIADGAQFLLKGTGKAVYTVSFSPDGTLLAAGYAGGDVIIYRIADRSTKLSLSLSPSRATRFSFHPDGTQVAIGTTSHRVYLLTLKQSTNSSPDSPSGGPLMALDAHHAIASSVLFSPDGRYLYTASVDGEIYRWPINQPDARQRFATTVPQLQRMALSPDGTVLITGSSDGALRLWKTTDFQHHTAPVRVPFRTFFVTSDRAPADVIRIAVHPFQPVIFALSDATSVRMSQIDYKKPEPIPDMVYAPFVYGIDVDSSGTQIASAYSDGTIRIHRSNDGTLLRQFVGHTQSALDVSFSPDATLLASSSGDHTVRIWDVASQRQLHVHREHTAWVLGLAHSPDGKQLASVGYDATIMIRNATDGTVLKKIIDNPTRTMDVIFSNDGRLIMTAGIDKLIRIWDAQSGELIRTLIGHTAQLYSIVAHPDGELLASAGTDRTVCLWHIATGKLRDRYVLPAAVRDIDISPDKTLLAAPLIDGSVHLIQLDQKRPFLFANFPPTQPISTHFVNGTNALAIGFNDGSTRLWDINTRLPIWRTAMLLKTTPALLTHRGWSSHDQLWRPSPWHRQLSQSAVWGIESARGDKLCLYSKQKQLELWDAKKQRRLWQKTIDPPHELEAVAQGCFVRTDSTVHFYDIKGYHRMVATDAVAMTLQPPQDLAILSHNGLQVFSSQAVLTLQAPALVGMRQALWTRDPISHLSQLIIGYEDGQLSFVKNGRPQKQIVFDILTTAAVSKLIVGPGHTLIAGHENGQVGMWDLQTGKLLLSLALHGPIRFLWHDGKHLYAASDIGSYQIRDLNLFNESYPEFLKQIKAHIPIQWESGHPVRATADQPTPRL